MRISVIVAIFVVIVLVTLFNQPTSAKQENDEQVSKESQNDNNAKGDKKKKMLPKDPMFITDIDLEHLYDEWEETDEDKLEPDELPPHKRPPPQVNIPDLDALKSGANSDGLFKDPEKLMLAAKKGKTVMAFVTIANNPTKQETEMLTQRWQVGLVNAHMKCERFVIADDRAIFVFEDGSLAFEAKEFLLDQPELKEYSIDNRVWHGKAYPTEPVSRSDL